MKGEAFAFGAFELWPERLLLLRQGQPVPIGSRAFAILELLVRRAPGSVGNREILDQVWPGLFVEEGNIRVQVAALRRAMGEGHSIANRPGQGYVLNAAVRRRTAGEPAVERPPERADGLPAQLTPLIGREETVDALAGALSRHRFLTLTGAGGIGKTSVALAAARLAAPRYADGAVFADLAPLSGAGDVLGAVTAALGVRLLSSGSVPELLAAIRHRRILLVLDNCEHVVDGVALLAEQLLGGAPGLHILATSREPLRAQGEVLRRLDPLAAPPASRLRLDAGEAMRFPAVALFVERAMASQSAFVLSDVEAPAVAELCRRLDGIPLAIELAAARMDVLDLGGLIARLTDRLALLTHGRRTALPRQRTLRATLDWSYGLLTATEQAVLARLGVLRGAFAIEDAVAVGADEAISAAEVVDALAELIGKSMVLAHVGSGEGAYRLLDTMREYAFGHLCAGHDGARVALRHARHQRHELRRLADAAGTVDLVGEYRRRAADLRAALDWCFQPDADLALGIELTTASQPVWYQLSLMDEYRRHAERALAATRAAPAPDPRAEMQLLVTTGPALFNVAGSVPLVAEAFTRALALAERLGDAGVQRRSLWGLWLHRFGTGEYAAALELAAAFGRLVEGSDPTFMFHRIKALSHLYLGELGVAREHAEFVLAQAEARTGPGPSGYQYEQRVVTEAILARALWLQGFPDRALFHAERSRDDGRASGHMLSLCFSITLGAGPVALWVGDFAAARAHADELRALASEHALPFWDRHGQVLAHAAHALAEGSTAPDAAFLASAPWNVGHAESLAAFGLGFAPGEGFERFEHGAALWCTPEVLRLEADRRLRDGGPAAAATAEPLLLRARALATAQGALAWELRVALSLGRLWRAQGRREAARAAVGPVLARFTEGFATADLRAARAFLDLADTGEEP